MKIPEVLGIHHLLQGCLFLVLLFPTHSMAQSPTATITTLHGTATVSFQGQDAQAGEIGTVMQAGDTISTAADSEVVLTLSDGSELQLSEDTSLAIAQLVQEVGTPVRKSRMKMLWGRMRAILSPRHQEEGSSFQVDTANALIGVKFSKPDIEVVYNPDTETTIAYAYTVDLIVTNTLTNETKTVPIGHSIIIRGGRLTVGRGGAAALAAKSTTPSTTLLVSLSLFRGRTFSKGVVGAVPDSTTAGMTNTGRHPHPGSRTRLPDKIQHTLPATVNVQEE